MGKLSDTSSDADRVLTEVYRNMPIGKKWLLLGEDYRCARILHAAGVRQRNPGATPADIQKAWLAVNLGYSTAEIIESPVMDQNIENLGVVREVVGAFDRLGIPYALGGSMASSVHGINRISLTRNGLRFTQACPTLLGGVSVGEQFLQHLDRPANPQHRLAQVCSLTLYLL